MIEETVARHERIILQFSGGKDSLATLYLMRPWWEKILVVWANSGDAFPETLAQMQRIRNTVPRFFEARADQPRHIAEHGWPSDLVSVDATAFGDLLRRKSTQRLQPYPACCGTNIWAPMEAAVAAFGATLVIRGTRKDDSRRGPEEPGAIIGGVEFLFPVWDWTAGQVMEWLKKENIDVPDYYKFTGTSLDCRHCTAYLDENAGKMRYISMMHRELSDEIQKRLKTIRHIVMSDVAHITKAVL